MKPTLRPQKKNLFFPTVAIIGLGLIGGSIALEIQKHQLAQQVWGVDLSPQNRKEALRLTVCQKVFAKAGAFLKQADLVILAVPVSEILSVLPQLVNWLSPHALVTDVGSTKMQIVQKAAELKLSFIGGHPIAGTEQSGMKAALLDLFRQRHWILTKPHSATLDHQKRWVSFLKLFGARVSWMDAQAHDTIFAAVSHLPNLLSFALAGSVLKQNQKTVQKYAGRSFQEMTRLAASPARMWRDIWLSNRAGLIQQIESFEEELSSLKKMIQNGNSNVKDSDQLLKRLARIQRLRL